MKPVDQTLFGDKEGNCYAACLASILELPIEDVPNFCAESKNWLERAEEWLRVRHSLTMLGFRPRGEGALYCIPTMWHLISGKAERGLDHAVVAFQGKVQHDPHPSRVGLAELNEYEFLIPINSSADFGKLFLQI